MDPMRELPLGFGMALCANQAAADVFARMTPQRHVAGLAETEGL